MKVRKAILEDARGIAKVQIDSWQTTYKNIIPDEYLKNMSYKKREAQWRDIINNQTVFVAVNGTGKIIGFSNSGKERTGNYPNYIGELYAIYILESYQRKGLGKLLLEPIIEEFKQHNIFSMAVLVLSENDARLFYEALGAKKLDTIEIEILGTKLYEYVYGWQDISEIKLT